MSRILALDYGDKRIGVALSDPMNWTAQPLAYVENGSKMWQAFQKLVSEYEVESIIVGLPKNREGGDSEKAKHVRVFAEELANQTKCKIIFRDERFSTKAVERHLIAADVSREKRRMVIDSQSAAFVLQGYLDSLGGH